VANQQGWSQQTPAIQSLLRSAVGGMRRASGSSKRRKKKKSAGAKRAKRSAGGSKKAKRATSRGKKARLVKGSAAAKAYMAKIRKKRK